MVKTTKRNREKGVALFVALVAILTIALLAAFYFRSSGNLISTSQQFSTSQLLQMQTQSMAGVIRTRLIRVLGQGLDLNNDGNYEIAPILTAGNTNSLTNDDFTNVSFDPGEAGAHFKIEKMALQCLWEGADRNINCTKNRTKMPKNFRLKFSAKVPEKGVLFTYTENFEITYDRLTEYSMVIGNSVGQVNFGDTEFIGNVGVFFKDPTVASSIIGFLPVAGSGHSIFRNILVTNIPDDLHKLDHMKVYEDSSHPASPPELTGGVAWGITPQYSDSMSANVSELRSSASHSLNTAASNDFPSLCGSSPPYKCESADSGAYRIRLGGTGSDQCKVQVFYYKTGGSPVAQKIYDGNANDDDIFLLGSQSSSAYDGLPTYITGSESTLADARVCNRMTFVSEGDMFIRSSIQKHSEHNTDTEANVAFAPKGDIRIDDKTLLTNNQTIAAQRTASAAWSGSDPYSLKIEAALVPVCKDCDPTHANDIRKGNIVVDPSVMPATSAANAKEIGGLQIKGIIATNAAPISKKTYNVAGNPNPFVDGFKMTQVEFNQGFRTSPPPGLSNVNVGDNLIAVVNSATFDFQDIAEATSIVNNP